MAVVVVATKMNDELGHMSCVVGTVQALVVTSRRVLQPPEVIVLLILAAILAAIRLLSRSEHRFFTQMLH